MAAEPKYRLNPANWNMEPISDAPAEAVLITIDDAPADHSVEMAATLKELDVPAIFFVNGHFLDSDEEKANLKKNSRDGLCHRQPYYNHNNLKTIGEEQQQEEILSLSEAVEEIIGEKPKVLPCAERLEHRFQQSVDCAGRHAADELDIRL
ncbi:polysaccharide deacetylase family protein [Planococcus glaciei]|nr:polysaccharide deacetylase family protein [Planococcus glaciei]